MNKSIISIMTILIIVIVSTSAYAQPLFQFGGNLTIGLPQNEFKDNVQNTGFGGTGNFSFHFPQTPLAIGISGTFLIYGSETREEPFSTTIPDVFVDVATTNNIVMGHVLLRLQPPRGIVKPYLDGLFGLNYLWTRTTIKNQSNNEEVASSTNFDDITFGYGFGGGLMIRVYDASSRRNRRNGLNAVYIDLGLRYLRGGEAEYLKEGSIRIENGRVRYDVNKSTTDILMIHIGASITFNPSE
ncbi:MAG: hypothetical protein ABIL68_14295 [bacterium]